MQSNIHPATSDDYDAVPPNLMFAGCQMRSCVSLSIINDMVVENVESFGVSLKITDDLDSRIIFNPANGKIDITDNDSM